MFENSFMKPEIYFGGYYTVGTTAGTEIIPDEIAGNVKSAIELTDYLEGNLLWENLEHADGWLARLSAPGYLDCTEWSAHKTEKEALEYLENMYGNDA